MNKYQRRIIGFDGVPIDESVHGEVEVTIDVYDVLQAFNVTNPATAHAIKKLLVAGGRGYKDVQHDVRKGLQAMFNAMPKQEPVGYVYTHRLKELNDVDKDCVFFKYTGSRDSKWFTPLYTHPQPPHEPLTLDEISIITNDCEEFDILDFDEIITLVRAVEKAHGIGVQYDNI
jgi:hypothetical protein